MFTNIGAKIKNLATVTCWIGIIASFIFGLLLIADAEDSGIAIAVGLLVMGLGTLFSWIGSFMTYGFGELIEKTTEIAENTGNANQPKSTGFCTVCGGPLNALGRCDKRNK